MAFRNLESSGGINLKCIELISLRDDAVDEEGSNYDEYIKTLDRKHLKLNGEPSLFILNMDFKGKEAQQIKNASMSAKDDDGKASLALGSLSFTIARLALKDIKHPEGEGNVLPFMKGRDNNAHENLIGSLDRMGVVNEILAVYSQHVANPTRTEAKNS